MIEFIDKTPDVNGTKINRHNLMAAQGFIGMTTVFNDDGSITETNAEGQTRKTYFQDDGSIVQIFQGQKQIVKLITFPNGNVKEVIK